LPIFSQDKQIDALAGVGLSQDYCYYFHVENHCIHDKRGCKFIHDEEKRKAHKEKMQVGALISFQICNFGYVFLDFIGMLV
jgi:hypothetical protein